MDEILTNSKTKIEQISNNELIIYGSINTAFDLIINSLQEIGQINYENREGQFIQGTIMYGFQAVSIRVSFVEREEGRTNVVIQGSSDDIWGAGAKNATSRLVETTLNFDNPGYSPDKSGINPLALGGILAAFVIIIWWILSYLK